ncbi:hypothetical protein ACFLXU_04325 [Chloroflexota bacterium]
MTDFVKGERLTLESSFLLMRQSYFRKSLAPFDTIPAHFLWGIAQALLIQNWMVVQSVDYLKEREPIRGLPHCFKVLEHNSGA